MAPRNLLRVSLLDREVRPAAIPSYLDTLFPPTVPAIERRGRSPHAP